MTGFIPFFILVGAAISIPVFRFIQRGAGIAWLFAVTFSLASWISTLVLKSSLPFSFSGHVWSNLGIGILFPFFEFNLINWPFVFMISAIVCGTLISSSIRLSIDGNFKEWIGILIIGAIGILGSMAGNLITIIMVFGLLDIFELFIFIFLNEDNTIEQKKFYLYNFWRFAGLVIFLLGLAYQFSIIGYANEWDTIGKSTTHFVILSCLLRLRILPFNALTGKPGKSQNSLFVSRYLISFLLVISVLYKIPFQAEITVWNTILLGYLLLVAIIASIRINLRNETDNNTSWLLVIACLFIAEYLYGYSSMGVHLIFSATAFLITLFLDSPGSRFNTIITFIALLSFSGLPFTPNDTGLLSFKYSNSIPGYLFLFPGILLFAQGISKTIPRITTQFPINERWLLVISPLGLVVPLISSWIISYFWIGDSNGFTLSIQALIMTLGGLGLFIAQRSGVLRTFIPSTFETPPSFVATIKLVGKIYQPKYFSDFVHNAFKFPLSLFEGDGGILWTILCLVLVITIIRSLGYS